MKTAQIVLILSTVFFCTCALQENDVDDSDTMQEVNLNPVLASPVDSLKVNEAKSSIQCSPEYILASFTIYKDGLFTVEITEEELNMLGVSEKSYQDYLKGLSLMNKGYLNNAE